MEEYATGDIVLLSHSKLGVMTSSSTVREIRGEDTDITRIVKKLSAKELAETLVDLMERYNNLESKSRRHSLKEGNTDSTTNTKTTASYTKHTKSSKDTSSSDLEPKPKSINNDLDIPKTPNYANHTISPTDSKQHMYYGHHTGTYIRAKRGSDGDTPSTKSNDESATTTTSTISSLSPGTTATVEVQIGTKSTSKSPKPKKKLFGKIRKNKKHSNRSADDHKYHKVNIPKAKSSRFLFKNKNRKNTKTNNKKISKRSSSSETHYMRHTHAAGTHHHAIPTHTQHQTIDYMGCTHEYLPYPHDAHAAHTHGPHLPFSHIRSNPDDIIHIEHKTNHHLRAPHSIPTHLQHTNAPKTRFSRSKSTDTYPYHHNTNPNTEHHHLQHRYHNPYFIAYTPSHHTNNSNTPPIPSPNVAPFHLPPYAHHYLHHVSPNASSYSSTAPAPMPMQLSPYALYNRYNLHFHPNYYSTPNMDAEPVNDIHNTEDKLIDALLSVPPLHKKHKKDEDKDAAAAAATTPNKKKSHPISYKKRTIKQISSTNKGTHCDGLLMSSRTALTESISPSQSGTPPTYPQQYKPNHVQNNQMILNLLNSPEPPQSVVDPIMANYSHLKHVQNRSNTMDTEDTTHTVGREREVYLNYNNYPENSYSQSQIAKRDRKIMNQYISSNNNDSMIYNDSTSIRGGSHSPRNSSYSFRRKNYHSPRGSHHAYHAKRPFSATNKHQKHKYNNYFDFGPCKPQQRVYHNKTSYSTHNKHNNHSSHHGHSQHSMTKSNTVYSEIEGKNEYSSQNKTAAIKPFHPQTTQLTQQKYKKPKLTQHYSSPADNYPNLKQMAYHKPRGKTMGHDINLELGLNLADNGWLLASDFSSPRNMTGREEEEEEETEDIRDLEDAETVINHNVSSDTSNKYNEGRKSQSFSVLALGKSLDDMTPLVLSPQSRQNAHHNKPRRSRSVANIFDPIQPSRLGDLHEINLNLNHIRNINSNNSTIGGNRKEDTSTDTDLSHDEEDEEDEVGDAGHTRGDKNYKIEIHSVGDDSNNNMKFMKMNNKPRFSQSASIQTAQSGQSNTSFTPTMSQTPSYLRESHIEEAKWAKSMKISQSTAASSQCSSEADSRWMMYNQININGGGTDSRRQFFGDNDEIDEFPNIGDFTKEDEEDPNSQLSPKHTIANEDELEMQMQMQKRNKYKHQLSPTSNTSDTDTISKSYIY